MGLHMCGEMLFLLAWRSRTLAEFGFTFLFLLFSRTRATYIQSDPPGIVHLAYIHHLLSSGSCNIFRILL